MLAVSVNEVGKSATLSAAILLYGDGVIYGDGRDNGFATVHKVATIATRPEIMPGRLLTQKDLAHLATGLGLRNSRLGTNWVDPSILAQGPDRIIWWSSPGTRSMFFKPSGFDKETFEGYANCPVPGLVWMAMPEHGLYVYGVKGHRRPDQGTRLYQAPFFNVWGRGKVCLGSAQRPVDEKRWDVQSWEQTLFGSNFTHPNFTEKDRLIKGMRPGAFWKSMVEKPLKKFPEHRLVEMPLDVKDLLDPLVLSRLSKLPVPKGEF